MSSRSSYTGPPSTGPKLIPQMGASNQTFKTEYSNINNVCENTKFTTPFAPICSIGKKPNSCKSKCTVDKIDTVHIHNIHDRQGGRYPTYRKETSNIICPMNDPIFLTTYPQKRYPLDTILYDNTCI